jgi:hypothetical protein
MEKPPTERRCMSQSGLLDAAIRQVANLAFDTNPATKALAGQALATLLKLRHMMPMRRKADQSHQRR